MDSPRREERRPRRAFSGLAVTFVAAGMTLVGCAGGSKPPGKPITVPATGLEGPPVACVDFSFSVYFETASEDLTPAARQEIAYAAARVKGCRLGSLAVVGLSDADGPARLNLELSRSRAAVVARALTAAGLLSSKLFVEGLGEAGAVAPGGDPEPLRRRVDVLIRASAPSGVDPAAGKPPG